MGCKMGQRPFHPAVADRQRDAGSTGHACGEQFCRHAARTHARPGFAGCHRHDVGGERLHHRQALRGGIGGRIGGVETINVGQQDHPARPRRLGRPRRQPIIVAKADFGGGHRVILVQHRHRAQIEQAGNGGRDVEIAPPVFQIAQRQQHLCRRQALCGQQGFPYARQCHLPDGGSGLRVFKAGATALFQAQPTRPQGNGAGRHNDDLLALSAALGDVGDHAGQPLAAHRARCIHKQGRANLYHQPRAVGRVELASRDGV